MTVRNPEPRLLKQSFFTLIALAILFAACEPGGLIPIPVDDTVDDSFAVPSNKKERGVFISSFENPTIGGSVRLADVTFDRLSRGRRETCCDRVTISSSGNHFIDGDSSVFAAVTGSSASDSDETGEEGVVWLFRTPAVSLPEDGSPVTLTLERSTGDYDETGPQATQTIQVALDDDVIVLPVYVHLFEPDDGRSPRVDEKAIQAALERSTFFTSGTSVDDPVERRFKTFITSEEISPAYDPPDDVWEEAGIQFKLADFEVIRQNDRLDTELISNVEASEPFGGACRGNARVFTHHQNRQMQPGIHVYIGGQIDNNMLLSDFAGGTCGAFRTCRDSINREDLILLDWSKADDLPLALAHELGHYLGLHHPAEERSCGAVLVGDDTSDNLMSPAPTGDNLTEAQIEQARTVACSAFRNWGLPSAACR